MNSFIGFFGHKLIMEFSFLPQNLAEVFGFFALIFILMLAFYFLAVAVQHRIRPEDESHCRQNGGIPKQVGRACLQGHNEIGRSNRQNETLAVWQLQVVRRYMLPVMVHRSAFPYTSDRYGDHTIYGKAVARFWTEVCWCIC